MEKQTAEDPDGVKPHELSLLANLTREVSPLYSLGKWSLQRWYVLLKKVSSFTGLDGNAEIRRELSNVPLAILTQALLETGPRGFWKCDDN